MNVPINATNVEINGNSYSIKISDVDILQTATEIRKRCINLLVNDSDAIRNFLIWLTERIDIALGNGTALAIWGDSPVQIGDALAVYNAIEKAAITAHREYIKLKYGG